MSELLPWEGSTTRGKRRATLPLRAEGTSTARAQRGRFRQLAKWRRSVPLTLTIEYKGGAEGWYLIKARGTSGILPGAATLEDLMRNVRNDGGPRR